MISLINVSTFEPPSQFRISRICVILRAPHDQEPGGRSKSDGQLHSACFGGAFWRGLGDVFGESRLLVLVKYVITNYKCIGNQEIKEKCDISAKHGDTSNKDLEISQSKHAQESARKFPWYISLLSNQLIPIYVIHHYTTTYPKHSLPVVPHKAVAEVSKIGNL